MSDKLPSEELAELGYAIRVYSINPDEEVWRFNGQHVTIPSHLAIGVHIAKWDEILKISEGKE